MFKNRSFITDLAFLSTYFKVAPYPRWCPGSTDSIVITAFKVHSSYESNIFSIHGKGVQTMRSEK